MIGVATTDHVATKYESGPPPRNHTRTTLLGITPRRTTPTLATPDTTTEESFGTNMLSPHLAPLGAPQVLHTPHWHTGLPSTHGFSQHMAPPSSQQPFQTAHAAAV